MVKPKFKYQKQIDELLAKGCQLPELFAPNNMAACRFVFFSRRTPESYSPIYEQSQADATRYQ